MKFLVLAAATAAVLCAQVRQLPVDPSVPPETVVAKAGGKSITAGEVRSLLDSGDPNIVNLARQSPESFLSSVMVMRYLAAEGEKQHIGDQSPWKEQLQILRDRVIFSAVINQMRETSTVPDQAITDFYEHNKSRYDQARIKVIAIGFCPTVPITGGTDEEIKEAAKAVLSNAHCTSQRTEDQAHGIATGLVGRIRAGKGDYLKMVDQFSEDPDSKATAGDFGLVTRDNSFKAEIKAATFALNGDEISDPIKSGNFFYIIKLKEKTIQPLDGVRESIVQELKQKHFTDQMDEIYKRFKPTIERPDFFTPAK
jgi:hypothetical protein